MAIRKATETRPTAAEPDTFDSHPGAASTTPGRVFMLPFAGASAFAFGPLLPSGGSADRDRFVQIALPGHVERMKEPLLDDLEAIAAESFYQIADRLGPHDVVYGHSMGALLALLVVRRARSLLMPLPGALVVSGMRAPSEILQGGRHALPADALKAELQRLGGTPEDVLRNDEIFAFFEPLIRADFKAVETWAYRAEPPLPVPITVLSGRDDDTPPETLAQWQAETTFPIAQRQFDGGHFFIFDHPDAIRSVLLDALGKAANCPTPQ